MNMQTIQVQQDNYFDVTLFDILIESIKKFINKYKLSNIQNKLDKVINEFSSLENETFVVKDINDINRYDNFLEYLEKLQDYLEQLEDLKLTANIEEKIDNALNIVVILQFRISGAIGDYRLNDRCK